MRGEVAICISHDGIPQGGTGSLGAGIVGDFVDEFEGFVVEEGESGVCARDTAYVSPGDFALVFPAGGVGVDEEDVPGERN